MATKETLDAATQFFEDLLISISTGQFCLDRELFPPETRDITSTLTEIETLIVDALGEGGDNLLSALVAKKLLVDEALDTIGAG